MINVIFFGSSAYCVPLLESLHKHFNLKLIVTQPDKPVGRKKILTQSAPKQFAVKHNIPLTTPTSLTTQKDKKETTEAIAATHPTIAVVADYGHVIPKSIFTIPAFQTLNVHFGRLPKYRGASPVQQAILQGDKKITVTFFLMEETLDTGPIVFEKEFPLNSTKTTQELYTELFQKAAKEIIQVIPDYIEGKLQPKPQGSISSDVCKCAHRTVGRQEILTSRITRKDGFIPWSFLTAVLKGNKPIDESIKQLSPLLQSILKHRNNSSKKNNLLLTTNYSLLIERAWRAFSPWPGLYTEININGKEKRLKILAVVPPQMCAQHSSDGGTTEKETSHKHFIKSVQLEGKQPVSWNQFLEGYPEIKKEVTL